MNEKLPGNYSLEASMTEQAREIYSEASKPNGENLEFTEQVAKLVGESAKDYADLASNFECEAQIMRTAARIALEKAQELGQV